MQHVMIKREVSHYQWETIPSDFVTHFIKLQITEEVAKRAMQFIYDNEKLYGHSNYSYESESVSKTPKDDFFFIDCWDHITQTDMGVSACDDDMGCCITVMMECERMGDDGLDGTLGVCTELNSDQILEAAFAIRRLLKHIS